jgi:FMN phosphatase YigB (HAD superfamily)
MSNQQKVFVWDLDDTLMDNVHDYAQPILDACGFIVKTLGNKAPHVSAIIALEQEIDKRRVKETNLETGKPFLYSMERFPGSLVETYREICRRASVCATPGNEECLSHIGFQAFDEKRYTTNIKPNAKDVFDFLKGQGDLLYLCSKGDKRVQYKKVSALQNGGIDFAAIKIVADKNAAVFEELKRLKIPDVDTYSHYRLLDHFYSIGNSYESDIAPALSAGYRGIYIPVETWDTIGKMDDILEKVDKEKCIVFESLDQLITRYEEL